MDLLGSLFHAFFEFGKTSFRTKVFIAAFLILGLPALLILSKTLIS